MACASSGEPQWRMPPKRVSTSLDGDRARLLLAHGRNLPSLAARRYARPRPKRPHAKRARLLPSQHLRGTQRQVRRPAARRGGRRAHTGGLDSASHSRFTLLATPLSECLYRRCGRQRYTGAMSDSSPSSLSSKRALIPSSSPAPRTRSRLPPPASTSASASDVPVLCDRTRRAGDVAAERSSLVRRTHSARTVRSHSWCCSTPVDASLAMPTAPVAPNVHGRRASAAEHEHRKGRADPPLHESARLL